VLLVTHYLYRLEIFLASEVEVADIVCPLSFSKFRFSRYVSALSFSILIVKFSLAFGFSSIQYSVVCFILLWGRPFALALAAIVLIRQMIS